MPQSATAAKSPACTSHTYELAEDVQSTETKIKGVFLAIGFSVCCTRCSSRNVLKSSETCPYCFTSMESKRVDTEVSRFKRHSDENQDPLHYATIHTCPTCSFKCVGFTWDK